MIRQATAADSMRWWEIRNDPEALFWSDNKRPISHEEHARWWARVRNDYRHYLAVVDHGGVSSIVGGYGRFQRQDIAEVSLGMAPESRGHGFGLAMLQHLEGTARNLGTEQMVAYVHPGNTPSLRCFIKAGYVLGTSPAFTQLRKIL